MTETQLKLLTFLRAKEVTPSYREMAAHLGWKSWGGIKPVIDGLIAQGYVKRFPGKDRGLRVVKAKSEWRPIETAPKDGTVIILGSPAQEYQGKPVAPRVTVGHWSTEEECSEVIGDCGGECRCPEYKFHDPLWLSWDGGFTDENPATHWMPLPDAPHG